MGFVRFAWFLLVVLPLTSLSIINFHRQEDKDAKDAAQDNFGSLKMELLRNNIGGRRLRVKDLMELENSKSLGGGSQEKISNMALSSSSNGESGKKKNNNKNISSFERNKLGSGSTLVYNNADYLTYMHHPPKHN